VVTQSKNKKVSMRGNLEASPSGDAMGAQHRQSDRLLCWMVGVVALASVLVAAERPNPVMSLAAAVGWTVLLCLPGLLAAALRPGSLLTRLAMAFSLSGLVVLQIQLSGGTLEFHFGVFVTLALLMVYLDWRPIVFGAALFAVHHVLFDRLQDLGFGVYCLPRPDLPMIVLHAVYVVVQTVFEVVFVVRLSQNVRGNAEVAQIAQALRQGEQIVLDQPAPAAQAALARELSTIVAHIATTLQAVRETSDEVLLTSREIAIGNLDLSQRTEESASQLQAAAASMEELTATVARSADAVRQTEALARAAASTAQRGGSQVQQVVQSMAGLQASSSRIADITGVIDGIAFQTNILALNASIEAARAGAQGRGFAVVASEVRALAQRSATAAREIKDLIDASVAEVARGSALVHDAGSTMTDIVERVGRVNETLGAISHAAEAQSKDIADLHGTLQHLDQMTQQNASLVEESAAAADMLKANAQRLTDGVAVFRLATP
jgi:methyl-accepting chemotaxis protein